MEAEESREGKDEAPKPKSLPAGSRGLWLEWVSPASLNEGPCWFPQSCPLGLGDEREGGELHPPSPSLEMEVIWAGLTENLPKGLFPGLAIY